MVLIGVLYFKEELVQANNFYVDKTLSSLALKPAMCTYFIHRQP